MLAVVQEGAVLPRAPCPFCLLHWSLAAALLARCLQELMASRRGGTLQRAPVGRRVVFGPWRLLQQFCSLHEWWVLFWLQVLSELWLIPQHELLMPQENPVCD